MIIRIALAVLMVAALWLVWRNLGAAARFEAEQRKAWDEPLREGSAFVLVTAPRRWWWWAGLVFITLLVGVTLWERLAAGTPLSDAWLQIGLFAALAALCIRRAVQLSERVTVTWERMISRNLLGVRYDIPLDEVTGVTETDRAVMIALRDGRVLEPSPWLEGRFWLARELKARLEGRE